MSSLKLPTKTVHFPNTATVARNLPCLNPNCHSYGVPHPNCRCYGFAKGGKVEHFCSESRMHDPGCEYFKDGGNVYVDPSNVTIDPEPTEEKEYVNPSNVTVEPMNAAAPEKKEYVDPESVTVGDSNEPSGPGALYSQGIESAKAFAEGIPSFLGKDPSATLSKISEYVPGKYRGAMKGLAQLTENTPEKQVRAEEHPYATAAGKMAGYAAGAAASAELTGSKVLGNMIVSFLPHINDGIATSLMGADNGDTEGTVANALLSGTTDFLVNSVIDGLFDSPIPRVSFSKAKTFLTTLAERPIKNTAIALGAEGASKISHWPLIGDMHVSALGAAGILKKGADFADEWLGTELNDAGKKLIGENASPIFKKIKDVYQAAKTMDGRMGQALINALSKGEGNFLLLDSAANFAKKVAAGEGNLSNAVRSIVKGASRNDVVDAAKEEIKDNIRGWIEAGGIDSMLSGIAATGGLNVPPEGFAEGGEVQRDPHAFSKLYPQHNMLFHETKGRMSNYLKGIKPEKNPMRLPFDRQAPDKEKERHFQRALGFAAHPLTILNEVNKGTLTPDDMKDFTAMFPVVYSHISKVFTKEIMEAQLEGRSMPYQKRQALSLFLGAPLDSTFTPQAIQATQAVYAVKKAAAAAPQPGQKPKKSEGKSTSALSKMAPSHLTNEEARVQRQQTA